MASDSLEPWDTPPKVLRSRATERGRQNESGGNCDIELGGAG